MPSLTNHLYAFGEFRLDPQNRTLRLGEEPIALTPKAFEVLLLLIQHSGQVVSKDELMRAIWPDSFVEESNLTQTVFMLRKALGENPKQRYILTLQGRGYRFAADVEEVLGNGQVRAGPSARPPRNWASGTIEAGRYWGKKFWLVSGAVFLVLVAALTAYHPWPGSHPQQQQRAGGRVMLAVLPFENLTGDPTQEYFSDGLTEEMISQLGSVDPKRLGVIARTSVMRYKSSQEQLGQIGRELGVQYVLEGSVRRDAEKVRVSAQLIQVSDQTQLWTRQYDRELSGLLGLQDEITHEIADEIQLTLGEDKRTLAASRPRIAKSYEAYDLYLKGRYFWNKRTPEGFSEAIKYFQQAIAKDPDYARAYAGLADCYVLQSGYSGLPQTEFLPKARVAALKALQLDEGLAEAHTSLALITENYDLDWQTAEKEYRRAIELNPNYATAHHWYAEYLTWLGRFDEALRESEIARQLDPLSLIIASDNGVIFYFSRQYDRAEEKLNAVLEMEPSFARAHMGRLVYVEKGQFAKALADIEKYSPHTTPWDLAYVLGRAGHPAEAQHALEELQQRRPVDPAQFAWAYIGMGNKDQALAWLEKAYVQHSNVMVALKVEPGWDPLRSDPRFQSLVRRVGFPQ